MRDNPCSSLNNIRHRVKMTLLWKHVSERRRLRRRNEPQNEVSESSLGPCQYLTGPLPQATRKRKQATPEPEPEPEPTQRRGDDDGESLYASE